MSSKVRNIAAIGLVLAGIVVCTLLMAIDTNTGYADSQNVCRMKDCAGTLSEIYPHKMLSAFDGLYMYCKGSAIKVYKCDKCGIVQVKE